MNYETISKIQPFFLQGFRANRKMIPYLAQVSYDNGYNKTRCVGTIVNKRQILTISDCVPEDYAMSNYNVKINGYNWGAGERVSVSSIKRQKVGLNVPKVALVGLESDIQFSFKWPVRYVNRVCISFFQPKAPSFYAPNMNMVASISAKFIAPGWFFQGKEDDLPYIANLDRIQKVEEDYWELSSEDPPLMMGTPMIETNLLKTYLRGIYLGNYIKTPNRPTFIALENRSLMKFLDEELQDSKEIQISEMDDYIMSK